MVVQYFEENYKKCLSAFVNNCQDAIASFCSEMNEFVCRKAQENSTISNMGATVSGVVKSESQMVVFNAGDSRVYSFGEDILQQITIDNTEGQRMVSCGILTQEELHNFPNRKSLYKYVGRKTGLVPDVFVFPEIEKMECLLLCSDGLSDVLSMEDIRAVLSDTMSDFEQKGKKLLEMAVKREEILGDNITLIIID